MNKETVIIERGTTENIDELELLYDNLNNYLEANTNYPGWIKGIYPVRQTAIDGVKEGSLFILKINNIIAGSIILNHVPENAYNQIEWLTTDDYSRIIVVRTLVVNPLFMKKGIALQLMDFAKEYALSKNMKSIRLDVSENNIAAINLYEKSGYHYIGTVDLGLPYDHLKWFRLYEMVL